MLIRKRYQKLPVVVKILLPMLSMFLGMSTLGMYSFFNDYIERDFANQTEQLAKLVVDSFHKSEQVLEIKAQLLAKTPAILDATAKKNQNGLLQIVLPFQTTQELDFISVVDDEGSVLFESRQGSLINQILQDEKIKLAAKSGLQMFDIIPGGEDNPSVMAMVVPLKSREQVIGSLIVGYTITNELLERSRGSNSQHLVVLHRNRVVASTLSSANRLNWQPPQSHQGVKEVTVGALDYFAKTFPLSVQGGENVKIVLLNSVEGLEVIGQRLSLISALFASFGGISTVLLGLWMTKWLNRRLNTLISAVEKFSQGEFDTRIPIDSKDEIGLLVDAFNSMATQLTSRDIQLQVQMQELEAALQKLQQAQSQLVQSEKMSSLGQMVAGVAHEINNPVSFIHGNTHHIQDYTQNLLTLIEKYEQIYPQSHPEVEELSEEIELDFLREDLPKLLKSIQVGSDRITDIVLSLRNFSRLDEADFKQADIHTGIDSTLMILASRLKPQPQRPEIVVDKNYGELPLVECYPGQLNQVFMNILSNGIDALEERLKTDSEFRQPVIHIRTENYQNQAIIIRIGDNGMGMEENTKGKLFDPFFTTKPVGQGTGLGLSISYKIIVEKHQGQIDCESTLSEGTEFIIKMPIKQGF